MVVDPVKQEENRKKRYGKFYPQWRKLQDQLADSDKKRNSLKERKSRKQPKMRKGLYSDPKIVADKLNVNRVFANEAKNRAEQKLQWGKIQFPDILGDEPEDVTKKYTYPKSPSKETNYQTHIDKPIHWNALTGKIEREKEAEKDEKETAMNEEESLEELTDGELKEVEKLKAWEIWLEKTITGDANKPRPAKDDADPMGARVYQDGTLDFKRRGKYADQTIERPRKLPSNPHKTTQRGRSNSNYLTAQSVQYLPEKLELDYLHDPEKEHEGAGSTRLVPKKQKEMDEEWNNQNIISNTGDRRKKPKKKVKKAFWETWLSGGDLWEVWLNKKNGKKWSCNLCNIELPDDDLAEHRKTRHTDFHKDESIRTGGRKRNWTFGDTEYELKSGMKDKLTNDIFEYDEEETKDKERGKKGIASLPKVGRKRQSGDIKYVAPSQQGNKKMVELIDWSSDPKNTEINPNRIAQEGRKRTYDPDLAEKWKSLFEFISKESNYCVSCGQKKTEGMKRDYPETTRPHSNCPSCEQKKRQAAANAEGEAKMERIHEGIHRTLASHGRKVTRFSTGKAPKTHNKSKKSLWKSWLEKKKDQGQGDARYGNPHETGFEDPRVLQTSKDDFSMEEKEEDSNKPYIERKHEDDRDGRRQ